MTNNQRIAILWNGGGPKRPPFNPNFAPDPVPVSKTRKRVKK